MGYRVPSAALFAAGLMLTPSAGGEPNDEPWRPTPYPCTSEPAVYLDMAEGFRAMWEAYMMVFVAITPHFGLALPEDGTATALISLPASLPLGPPGPVVTRRSRSGCWQIREEFRPHRVTFEAGLELRRGGAGFVRSSYRSIWHPRNFWWGLGAGIGPGLHLGDETVVTFSPELLLQFGRCCRPLFWQLTLRHEHFFADPERSAVVVSFGPTVW